MNRGAARGGPDVKTERGGEEDGEYFQEWWDDEVWGPGGGGSKGSRFLWSCRSSRLSRF